MISMISFGVKNAFRRKTTLVIAIIGTGLGVGLMTTLLSLSEGMNQRIEETTNEVAGDITISSSDAPFGGLAGSFFGGGSSMPIKYLDVIKSVSHVNSVVPIVTASVPSSAFASPSPFGSSLSGVDPSLSSAGKNIVEGRNYEADDEVIIGKELALRHKIATGEVVEPGMQFDLPIVGTPQTIELTEVSTDAMPGIPKENSSPREDVQIPDVDPLPSSIESPEVVTLTIVGVYETGSPLTDAFFYSNPATARKIAQVEDDMVSSFIARVDNVEYVEAAAQQIEEIFNKKATPISVSLAKDTLGSLTELNDIFQTFLLAISAVSSVAGGMSIFIIMLMNVNERLKEFGIFKASGWSNGNIISSVVAEATTVSLLGSGFGLLAGYGVTRIIDHYMEQQVAVITPKLIVGVLAFGVFMGVIGGLYPAINAARVAPMETIRGD